MKYLCIQGVAYRLTELRSEDGEVAPLFELQKGDDPPYHVSRHSHGWECTCGDWEWRHRNLDARGCKHIQALRKMGYV